MNMNEIGRFVLECLYWAVFFDEAYDDANPADKIYAPLKSTIGKLIIFAVAFPLMALAVRLYRKFDERRKKKRKQKRK